MEPDEALPSVPSPRMRVFRRALARTFYRVAAALIAAAAIFGAMMLSGEGVWWLRAARFGFFATEMLAPLVALVGTLFGRLSSARTGDVLLAPGAITLATASSRWKLHAAEVSSALLVKRKGVWSVELVIARGDHVELSVGTEAEGESVLDALGFLRGQRVMAVKSVGLASRARFMGLGLAFALLGGLFIALEAGFVLSSAALAVVTAMVAMVSLGSARFMLSKRSVILGNDGVTLQWGGSHFIAFKEISSVSTEEGDVWINLRTGQRKGLKAWIDDPAVRAAVGRRIELALWGVETRAEPRLGLLDPHGRSLAEWRASLAELSAPGGYRGAALQPVELAAALESPAATMEQRLGAALALAARTDTDGRTKIRVAADGCASVPVREAFIRIADGELEQEHLDEALHELQRASQSRG